MLELHRIFCATDFSDASTGALEAAAELARRFDARLVLFHAHQAPAYLLPDGMLPVAPQLLHELERSIQAELTRLALELRDRGLAVETCHSLGPAAPEILRVAEEQEADLIVLGTHGRSGFSHLVMGSVAEKVVRKAKCPVLTVRPTEIAEGHAIR